MHTFLLTYFNNGVIIQQTKNDANENNPKGFHRYWIFIKIRILSKSFGKKLGKTKCNLCCQATLVQIFYNCFAEPYSDDFWIILSCLASPPSPAGRNTFCAGKKYSKTSWAKKLVWWFVHCLALVVSVFHAYDFLPLLRRVIRKSCCSALEQFLLTQSKQFEYPVKAL